MLSLRRRSTSVAPADPDPLQIRNLLDDPQLRDVLGPTVVDVRPAPVKLYFANSAEDRIRATRSQAIRRFTGAAALARALEFIDSPVPFRVRRPVAADESTQCNRRRSIDRAS
jgi:hypothetical protein